MDLVGKAKRVRIYLGEGGKVWRKPAWRAILELLRGENARGATLVRGASGFGSTGRIHTPRLVDVAQDLPVVVEWIDTAETVERLLPRVKDLVPRGLVTVDDTEVALHRPSPVRELPREITAGEVMSRDVASVTGRTPVSQVIELMLGKLYRAVPVVEDGVPVGIISNGDLIRKGGLGVRVDLLHALDKPALHDLLGRLAASREVASQVMTAGPVTVHEGTPLPQVAEIMSRRKLKRLPVVGRRGALVGMVSRVDVLRTAAGSFARQAPVATEMSLAGDAPLSQVMRRDVPTVERDTPLAEVFQAVVSTGLNRAFVVDAERRVVGKITDAELLDRLAPSLRPKALRSLVHRLPFSHPATDEPAAAERHARARRAEDLMSDDFVEAREDALLSDAIARMLKGNHKVVVVTDAAGRLAGIVDRADLLHGLVSPD
jgi:CBS domain-containing protein